MAMNPSSARGLAADINVTPLIDVLLVLLIIFMVIQPATRRGLQALLPQPPKTDRPDSPSQPIVVQVIANGEQSITYKLNQEALTKDSILPRLSQIFAIRSDKSMFLQGDPSLNFADVAEIIDYGHQAGAENIAILTPQTSIPNTRR